MRKPSKPFRILRHAEAKPITVYYRTAEERDAGAAEYAAADGRDVLTEGWYSDVARKCDPINRGWAVDGVVKAPGNETRPSWEVR